jgi:hypothetical protein
MVTWVMWNLVLVRLKQLLVSVQVSYTVCGNHTVGSEIIFGAPYGTPR